MKQLEHALSHWVDQFLDRALLGPCWYTAVDTGTWRPGATREQRMAIENKRKARGIKPAHLDWYVWQHGTGRYAQFELKVDGRPTRPGQDQTMLALRRNKIPTGVFEAVPDVCEFLIESGFALHANAERIAAELHERYLANRRQQAPKPAAKARVPRAPRHTASRRLARHMHEKQLG